MWLGATLPGRTETGPGPGPGGPRPAVAGLTPSGVTQVPM